MSMSNWHGCAPTCFVANICVADCRGALDVQDIVLCVTANKKLIKNSILDGCSTGNMKKKTKT